MKRIIFKGFETYLPDRMEIDDAVPILGAAAAQAGRLSDQWQADELDVAMHTSPGKYVIRWLNGKARIHVLPQPHVEWQTQRPIVGKEQWRTRPTLAISLCHDDTWPPDYQGDTYGDLLEMTSTWWYLDKETENLYYSQDGPHNVEPEPKTHIDRHFRLKHVGRDDNVYSQSSSSKSYTPVDDQILFQHEFAYRILWDPFGNHIDLDPVIFTCGNYEHVDMPPTFPEDWQYYQEWDRDIEWRQNHLYELVAGNISKTSMAWARYTYSFTHIEDYTIPGDLYADNWPEEMIDNVCYEPGTYQVWLREELPQTYGGTELYMEWGETVDQSDGYPYSGFTAFVYHRYDFTGGGYFYQMILHVDGQEWTLISGTTSGGNDIDDNYSDCVRIYDLNGQPVVVFSWMAWPGTGSDYFRYGIVFAGELWLSEAFVNDKGPTAGNWNRHDVYGSRADRGLEGYGQAVAIGIETYTETDYPSEHEELSVFDTD